jgi:hypothetical protein
VGVSIAEVMACGVCGLRAQGGGAYAKVPLNAGGMSGMNPGRRDQEGGKRGS